MYWLDEASEPLNICRVPPSTVRLPLKELHAGIVRIPAPILVRLPEPHRSPECVVLKLLPPTVRATADKAALLSIKLPGPCKPPKVELVSVPKLNIPWPLVSNVLPARAAVLA